MSNSEIITVEKAKQLLEEKRGTLNSRVSLLPAVEIYELTDGTLLEIKVKSKKATIYFNKDEALEKIESNRPKGLFEKYQDQLIFFPTNKDSILQYLSSELNLKIDPTNLEKKYLEKITEKVKDYSINKARDKLLLGLVVLMGEQIIHKKGGIWKTETISFLYPQKQPYIFDNKAKSHSDFVRIITDCFYGKSEFDWYIMSKFIVG